MSTEVRRRGFSLKKVAGSSTDRATPVEVASAEHVLFARWKGLNFPRAATWLKLPN
jgi:hypothetical protein